MNLWFLLLSFYSLDVYCDKIIDSRIGYVFFSQDWEYEDRKIDRTIRNIKEQESLLNINNSLFLTTKDILKDPNGYWTIFPILTAISSNPNFSTKEWYLLLEPSTTVNIQFLNNFIESKDINKSTYYGKAVIDTHPVIIHHYYGYDTSHHKPMYYPLTASGLLMNINFIKVVAENLRLLSGELSDFNIDAKFEFTKFLMDRLKIGIIDDERFCFDSDRHNLGKCITIHKIPLYGKEEEGCGYEVDGNNVFFGVKTFSGYHNKRLPVILGTWAENVENIGLFSDENDSKYSTIKLDIPNTSKGHCEKTMRIIRYFVEDKKFHLFKWLVIGDDDTLFNVNRLYKMLSCINYNNPVVVGERYGFGHLKNLKLSYDYPTGGSGMFFSRNAAKILAEKCFCPSHSTPDDMIIGN
uniref:Beta-1,3-glucosyltransferase (inferred by orthology to a human protein) n=1 Tax=Strongyloides venezuelensis TaxID=75913 RepID=A0A0K0FNZ3_STRVS